MTKLGKLVQFDYQSLAYIIKEFYYSWEQTSIFIIGSRPINDLPSST